MSKGRIYKDAGEDRTYPWHYACPEHRGENPLTHALLVDADNCTCNSYYRFAAAIRWQGAQWGDRVSDWGDHEGHDVWFRRDDEGYGYGECLDCNDWWYLGE